MNPIIEKLKSGQEVTFKPRGSSMVPLIHSGEEVTLTPLTDQHVLTERTIVYVQVKGSVCLHLITAISKDRYQISNNQGHVNGWVARNRIYGVLKR
ncbi:hypothetical protein [Deinococcus roseus]|uniref:Peptidase S24/S26A/S26B/S26C domain-containing protein n=1 Tax=Deinococcus roseus TaxID=392414 RepID=A0ABQ2DD22_9DEIO|nr:hypothetical protein [Deinococcus roseus]GGJ53272.1 hypothetical protein GCM10008938_44100 [Deinococcus roseus]